MSTATRQTGSQSAESVRLGPSEQPAMAALLACPECGFAAEIKERFRLGSSDGAVEHVAVACVTGHHFRMALDRLAAPPDPARRDPTGSGTAHAGTSAVDGIAAVPAAVATGGTTATASGTATASAASEGESGIIFPTPPHLVVLSRMPGRMGTVRADIGACPTDGALALTATPAVCVGSVGFVGQPT
jgi:hypothetical protein